ncbi:triose-phosphate isomerase [Candidatus Micrarchaeota archaeon CG10_big_fil_rev_8_21_14_0_10_54_18]|nr:MAG: triose-phosphate isomerase [Candidatus Micrarchaeota archaeon CG09_land_8_20_14_0_10_55_25]PJD01561.1 MAG: triose-phosphate isomerase [Candidatus Micrarchaeota archaeon CG10_big_fil_rev_8_21_14_0_10_54_18]
MLVLNLKAYPDSAGLKGLKLAEVARDAAEAAGKTVVVCPQQCDLRWVLEKVPETKHYKVFAQHGDAVSQGSRTGWIPLEAVKGCGASGLLINHSEHRIENVKETIQAAKALRLTAVVCAQSPEESKKFSGFEPFAVAFEPPDLIGSGISVTTRPEVAEESIKAIKEGGSAKPFVGAGVSNSVDVRESFALGAEGVLLASAFVKAEKPRALLDGMLVNCP